MSTADQIERLRVHARGEPIRARLAAERMLSNIELRPRGFPPAAVLCIRRLKVARPSESAFQRFDVAPPRAWFDAVEAEVASIARRAARPALDHVTNDVEAVVFRDRAELLACMARDLVAGVLAERWWWKNIRVESSAAVAAEFRSSPEHVPQAAALIIKREPAHAVQLVRLWRSVEVQELVVAVGGKFAARASAEAVFEALRRQIFIRSAPSMPARVLPRPAVARAAETLAPWAMIVPEADSLESTPAERALVAFLVGIARAPQLVRSKQFALEIARWFRKTAIEPVESELDEVAPSAEIDSSVKSTAARPAAGSDILSQTKSVVRADRPLPAEKVLVPVKEREVADVRGEPPRWTQLPEPKSLGPIFQEILPEPVGAEKSAEIPVFVEEAGPAPASENTVVPLEASAIVPPARPGKTFHEPKRARARRELGPAFESSLGGIFYLVNVALALRYYSDDGEHDLDLPLWDFIEISARFLLEGATVEDPVWRFLAELSERTVDEAAGASFVPPNGMTREAWWAETLAGAKKRLLEAFPEQTAENIGAFILRHKAAVHHTETHLDIVLSLEELPIEIRLAGLDRDPGWLPAAGKFIAFHFE